MWYKMAVDSRYIYAICLLKYYAYPKCLKLLALLKHQSSWNVLWEWFKSSGAECKAHASVTLCHWGACSQKDGLLLNIHRKRRFIRDRSPGHPPQLSHSSRALKDGADKLLLFWRWHHLWSGVSDSVLLDFFSLLLCYWPDFLFLFYKDIYLPVTFKCTQELVLVTFRSYSALTNRQNITVSHV